MPRRLIPLLLPLLFILPAGCASRASQREMDSAEALMDSLPDSALAILRAIDPQSLSSPFSDEPHARHALLLSQALDKNGIDIADDSLISVAYDYYASSPDTDPRRRMLAFYYRGVVDHNAGNPSGAIYNFTIADTLAARIGDYRYRGLANSRIALSFSEFSDLRRELDHSLRGLGFFRLAADSANIRRLLKNVGLCYNQVEEYDSAMIYFHAAGYEANYQGVASALIGLDSLDAFREIQKKHPELGTSPRIQCWYARSLIRKGLTIEASDVIDSAYANIEDGIDSLQWLTAHALLLRADRDWEGYVSDIEKIIEYNAESFNSKFGVYSPNSQSLAKDFVYMTDLQNEADRRHTLYTWLAAALILLVITVMGALFYHNAKKQKFERRLLRLGADNTRLRRESDSRSRNLKIVEEEKKALSDYARDLQQQLDGNNGQTSSPGTYGIDFILERKEKLNMLVDKYLILPSSENGETRLSLHKEIRTYDSPEFHERVDSIVNSRFEGYMVKAREARLSKTELSLLRLLICGFSSSQIGVILDVGQGALSTRKSRLKGKIKKLGLPEMPSF